MSTSHSLVGTWRLLRLNLRVDRIRGSVWLLGIAGMVLASALSVRSLYSTPREIAGYAAIVNTSPAMASVNRAFNGPGIGLEHPNAGVVLVNEVALWGSVAFSLMAVFLMARHTRVAEEDGRVELLRAQPIGRHAPIAAAAATVTVFESAAGVLILLGLVAMGYGSAGTTALVLAFVATGCVFATLTAVGAQVVSTGRSTIGVGLAAFGGAFALRAIGDVGDGTLSWFSPLGWVHRVRPFAQERWWVLALSILAVIAGSASTVALADRRDLGSGMVPQREGKAHATTLGSRPIGLMLRLQKGSTLAWTAGVFVLGVAYGSVASDIESVFADNPDLARFMPNHGASVTDTYLAYTLTLGALLVSGAAIASVLRLRHDETGGRLELVLAHPVSRLRWMGDQLAVASLTAVVTLAASGLGTGIGVATTTGDVDRVLRLTGASLALVPLPVVLVGLTTLLIGAAPRFTAVAWGVLALFVTIALLADALRLPDWLRALSPLDHLARVPADPFDVGEFVAVTVVGAVVAMFGAVAFRHRDIPST